MGGKAPEAPDPYAVADAQTGQNIKTAMAQQRLAMTGQTNPYGSTQFVVDPTSPSGYRQVTQFTPEMQALQGQSMDLQALSGDTIGKRLGGIADRGEFSMDAGRGAILSDVARKMLDPMWEQRQGALETQLANEGIMPGSEAWQNRMRSFGQQRSDNYDKMFLDSFTTANDAAMKEWLLPLQELGQISALRAGQPMPQLPQFGQTSSPGVAPVDLTSMVNNNYNQQVAQSNASMGGLYGLGAAGLGGWASAGFPGAAAALSFLSDRRVKRDIELLGEDPRGFGIYRFRYLWSDREFIGHMADEVEAVFPEAVVTHENGIKSIIYSRMEA